MLVQMMMHDAISGADHHAIGGAGLRASTQGPIQWRRLIFCYTNRRPVQTRVKGGRGRRNVAAGDSCPARPLNP